LAMEEIDGFKLWGYFGQNNRQIEPDDVEEKKIDSTGGMKFNVFVDKETGELEFRVITRMKEPGKLLVDTQFLGYVYQIQLDLGQFLSKLDVCAEHTRDSVMFRAHPNYRGKGLWRDWVMVQWEQGEFPAQIWGFLDLTVLPEEETFRLSSGDDVYKGIWAIVESASYTDLEEGNRPSEIFTHLTLDAKSTKENGMIAERQFFIVDVECFTKPLVVIANVGTKMEYLMMTPRDEWSLDFIRWIEASHLYEQQEMTEGNEE
jgi:hypothetical protein